MTQTTNGPALAYAEQNSEGFSLRDALRLLRANWATIVASVLAGLLLATVWCFLQPRTYQSTTTAVVTAGVNENLGVALTADNLAKSKAVQYEQLATSSALAKDAVEISGLDLSPEAARSAVSVTVPQDTAQVQINAVQSSPERAQRLANAWVDALQKNVQRIENSGATIDRQGNASRDGNGSSGRAAGSDTGSTQPGQSIIQVQRLVEASLPTAPHSPNVRLAVVIGGLAGLLAGLVIAFVRTMLDRRVKDPEALKERFGTTVLAAIPAVGRRSKKHRDADAHGATRALLARIDTSAAASSDRARRLSFRITESFKELRTNLQFMNPDHPPRVIVVTSSMPGEGKTTVSTNLAITLAQSNQNTVLVDGDLRRPVVAQSFGLVSDVGITNVVIGNAATDDVVQYVPDHPQLAVVAAGPVPPNPSEILASARFDAFIHELAKDSMVIIDAPPLLPVTDAAILAARYDGCILVVRAGHTSVDAVGKSVEAIDNVRGHLLGAVLNEVPTSGSSASYYQYYGDTYYSTQTPAAGGAGRRRKRRGRGSRG